MAKPKQPDLTELEALNELIRGFKAWHKAFAVIGGLLLAATGWVCASVYSANLQLSKLEDTPAVVRAIDTRLGKVEGQLELMKGVPGSLAKLSEIPNALKALDQLQSQLAAVGSIPEAMAVSSKELQSQAKAIAELKDSVSGLAASLPAVDSKSAELATAVAGIEAKIAALAIVKVPNNFTAMQVPLPQPVSTAVEGDVSVFNFELGRFPGFNGIPITIHGVDLLFTDEFPWPPFAITAEADSDHSIRLRITVQNGDEFRKSIEKSAVVVRVTAVADTPK